MINFGVHHQVPLDLKSHIYHQVLLDLKSHMYHQVPLDLNSHMYFQIQQHLLPLTLSVGHQKKT